MKQKKYDHIIWDWNGTLLNDLSFTVGIVNEIIEPHIGKKLSLDEYRTVFRFPVIEYYKEIGVDFERESFETLTKKFITNYNNGIKKERLHNKATDVLFQVNYLRRKQYILTAAFKSDVLELLDYYNLSRVFKAVEGLDHYKGDSKLNRGFDLLNKNEIDKRSTVYFGDTLHDAEVAAKLGVDCYLIPSGHQSKSRLVKQIGEDRVLDNIEQVLNIIG